MSEKEAFEAWFKKTHGYSALTDYDGSYEGPWTNGAWEAWKARAIPEGSVLVPWEVLETIEKTWRIPYPGNPKFSERGEQMVEDGLRVIRAILDQQVKP